MSFGQADPITPGYRTAVVFDKFSPIIKQPFFAYNRTAAEMMRGDNASQSNVAYLPGIGIVLRPHQLDPRSGYERDVGQTGYLIGANATVPSSVHLVHTARRFNYLGVDYNGVASVSRPSYQKKVAKGASWNNRLSADQTAFPGADTSDDPADLDRVFVTPQDHDPRDGLTFELGIPGSPSDRPGSVSALYFCGPAGSIGKEVGYGQYELKLHADGQAVLYEKGSPGVDGDGNPLPDAWMRRWQFVYSPVPASGMAYTITVVSDCIQKSNGDFVGNRIAFKTLLASEVRGGNPSERFVDTIISGAVAAISAGMGFVVYNVPQKTQNPTHLTKVRMDVRRDVRAFFIPSKHTYPLTGTILDDPFPIPFHKNGTNKLRVEWYGGRPTGTTVTLSLIRMDTGDEITGTVTVDDEFGQVVEFDLPPPDPGPPYVPTPRSYRPKFVLTGDGTNTPLILPKGWWAYISAEVETPDFDTLTVTDARNGAARTLPTVFPSDCTLSGVSEDPETENLHIGIEDLVGQNATLPGKTGRPVEVQLLDATTGTLVSILEAGLVQQNTAKTYGTKGQTYPNGDAYRLEVTAAGEWAILKRRQLPFRFNSQDPADPGQPIKATDAVSLLLHEGMAVPTEELDIPDLPQRLFVEAGGENLQTVEPGTLGFEIVKEIIEDYTGGYLLRDKNAGPDANDRGMWRMMLRHRPPYTNLLKIWRDKPATHSLPHWLGTYPDDTSGPQDILSTYAIRGTEVKDFEPAEGNFVQVFGSSGSGSSVGGLHPGMLTQVAFNPVSFNYYGLDPGHDFYPDPESTDFLGECVQIQVYDATLNTQEAVDWLCRRVFDSACFGREVIKVQCPLRLITEVADTLQVRARPPRFNDPVLYQQPDGSFAQYLVASCQLTWDWDGFIKMNLELVTTTNINSYGLPIGAFDYFDLTRARIKAAKTAMGTPKNSRRTRSRQREFEVRSAALTAWPSGTPSEIQYLDPEEPNFGQFRPMANYDPAP